MKIEHPDLGGVIEITEEQYPTFSGQGWKRAPDDEPTDVELFDWHRLQPDYLDLTVTAGQLRERWHAIFDQTPAGAPVAPPSRVNPPADQPPEGDQPPEQAADPKSKKSDQNREK